MKKAAVRLTQNNEVKDSIVKNERNNIPRSNHLSLDQLNKIAQLNELYMKNNKKKFNPEKFLLPQIKSESNNHSVNNTPTTTGHTIKINSVSISNVSTMNKTKKQIELNIKRHK